MKVRKKGLHTNKHHTSYFFFLSIHNDILHCFTLSHLYSIMYVYVGSSNVKIYAKVKFYLGGHHLQRYAHVHVPVCTYICIYLY